MSSALHVGNLPFDVTPSELRAWFEQCGAVKEVRIMEPYGSERSHGYAIVIMQLESSADVAIQRLDGSILEGRALTVTRQQGRPLAPRTRPKSGGSSAPFNERARPDEAVKERSLVRVQQQFRERSNMTYELDCSGTPLVVRIFFPVEGGPVASRWRVEAYTVPGSQIASAVASTRALALESLAHAWHAEDAERVPSKLDWEGVTRAMAAVRAI